LKSSAHTAAVTKLLLEELAFVSVTAISASHLAFTAGVKWLYAICETTMCPSDPQPSAEGKEQ
jgi:hypothetical protein